jgi:uncharacterized protein (DUF2267 family)
MVQYLELYERVRDLPFIADADTADAAVKSVLGHLSSRMDPEHARQLSEILPEPLSFGKMRGQRSPMTSISVEQFESDVREQFRLEREQVRELIETVFHVIKHHITHEQLADWEETLPVDWAGLLKKA